MPVTSLARDTAVDASTIAVVENYDELREANIVDGRIFYVRGRTTARDDGAGFFEQTSTSVASLLTADPLYGYTVPHATLASSAGGSRRLADPTKISPGYFGAKGDAVQNSDQSSWTDDYAAVNAAAVYAGTAISGVKQRGGDVMVTKRHRIGSKITVALRGVRFKGLGIERIQSGSSSIASPSTLIGTHTDGPVIHFAESDGGIDGIEIGASTARAAADIGDGYNGNMGVLMCPPDGVSTPLTNMLVARSMIRDQPSDGLHSNLIGEIDIDNLAVRNIGRNGVICDDGSLIGRSNKSRPGQIDILHPYIFDTGAYLLCLGNPSDDSRIPYRVILTNPEMSRANAEGRCFSGRLAGSFIRGEQIVWITGAACGLDGAGDAAYPGAWISGRNIKLLDVRAIGTLDHCYVLEKIDGGGASTQQILFDGAPIETGVGIQTYFCKIIGDVKEVEFRRIAEQGTGEDYINLTDKDTLTLSATGEISIILSEHFVSAYSGTSGTLVKVSGGEYHGQEVTLRPTSGHTILVDHNADNVLCGSDFTMNADGDSITLKWNAFISKWTCWSKSDNA